MGITRRRFLRGAAAVAALGCGAGLYTWAWEPHWVEFVRRPLPIARLPAALQGAVLVHLSDLHVGPRVSDQYLTDVFDAVNREHPDFVVYTGDFTSYHPDIFAQAERVFPRLCRGKRGTFGVLGNHDYGPKWDHPKIADRLAALAADAGVRVLRNEVADVEGLQIAGLDDLWAGVFKPEKAMATLDPAKACLALSHNPDTADLPGWGSFRGWILSGHTHGGQCKAPFLPPPLLPVRNRRYTAGEFALEDGRRMYISRGLGHLIQVRFNVRPEVTCFRLEQA